MDIGMADILSGVNALQVMAGAPDIGGIEGVSFADVLKETSDAGMPAGMFIDFQDGFIRGETAESQSVTWEEALSLVSAEVSDYSPAAREIMFKNMVKAMIKTISGKEVHDKSGELDADAAEALAAGGLALSDLNFYGLQEEILNTVPGEESDVLKKVEALIRIGIEEGAGMEEIVRLLQKFMVNDLLGDGGDEEVKTVTENLFAQMLGMSSDGSVGITLNEEEAAVKLMDFADKIGEIAAAGAEKEIKAAENIRVYAKTGEVYEPAEKQGVIKSASERGDVKEIIVAERQTPEFSRTFETKLSALRINDVSAQVENLAARHKETTVAEGAAETAVLGAEGLIPELKWDVRTEAHLAGTPVYSPPDRQISDAVIAKLLETGYKEDGSAEMTIVLKPQELGEVAVRLVKEGTNLSVSISAQRAAVSESIAARIDILAQNLTKDGEYQVREIKIVEPANALADMGLNFTDQGFDRRQDYGSDSGGPKSRKAGKIRIDDNPEDIAAEKIRTADYVKRGANLWITA